LSKNIAFYIETAFCGDVSNSAFSLFYDKNWANGLYREANTLLKEGFVSEGFWLWNQRLAAAIMIKTELLGHGYVWQAKRIENLIHRYQGKIKYSRHGGSV
jgi:hypothetical protein